MSEALHVESVGEGSPVVLLHGWGMHSGLWAPLQARLAHLHRLHAVELPGHGHSGNSTVRLADVAGALGAQFAGTASTLTVLGWSLGALIAMQWALSAPAQVSQLVLTGATPRFVRSESWPHGMEDIALLRFGDELRASYKLTLQRFISLQLQGSDDARNTASMLRHGLFARGMPSEAALSEGLELLRNTDLRERARDITQPTLIIAGDRDTLTPVAANRWLGENLPNARLQVIAGAAHVPFLSHPDVFAAAVEQFLHET